MPVITIGGGSGSGKTYLAEQLQDRRPEEVVTVPIDRYYRPFSDRSEFERMQINFDRPDTIDWELLVDQVDTLRQGTGVAMPMYSFSESTRTGREHVDPAPIVVVEGIHALWHDELNELSDLAVFVDPPADVRAVRRVRRDVQERDRSVEFAVRQYLEKTRPMHQKYVEPTREQADVLLGTDEVTAFAAAVDRFRKQDRMDLAAFIDDAMED